MESKKTKLRKFIKDALIIINEKITALTSNWNSVPPSNSEIIPESFAEAFWPEDNPWRYHDGQSLVGQYICMYFFWSPAKLQYFDQNGSEILLEPGVILFSLFDILSSSGGRGHKSLINCNAVIIRGGPKSLRSARPKCPHPS